MTPDAFEQPEFMEFFTSERNKPEDLYPSERRFLGWLASEHDGVLDVGCAAGGFADIWRTYAPGIAYTGVDRSTALVEAAQRLRPGLGFRVGDAADGLDLPDRFASLVQALGWLHWEPRYAQALAELWRVADRALFFDVRLHSDPTGDMTGAQALAGAGTTPYVVASWPSFVRLLLSLRPARLLGYGYEGPPAPTATGVPDTVCFAAFVVERGDDPRTAVCIDAPLEWPTELTSVERYPASELARMAPGQQEFRR